MAPGRSDPAATRARIADTAATRARIADLLPPGARAFVATGSASPPPLRPAERSWVIGAVAKRRREFAWGRHCARTALETLGWGQPSIPVGRDREPVWPAGVVGSITHCDGLCLAAVAPARELTGLGLDAEIATDVGDELLPLVATPGERAWLARAPRELLAVVFSAKESVFKCLFPTWRLMLEFRDVELSLDGQGGFTTRCSRGDARSVVGRYAVIDGFVVTVAFMRPSL